MEFEYFDKIYNNGIDLNDIIYKEDGIKYLLIRSLKKQTLCKILDKKEIFLYLM